MREDMSSNGEVLAIWPEEIEAEDGGGGELGEEAEEVTSSSIKSDSKDPTLETPEEHSEEMESTTSTSPIFPFLFSLFSILFSLFKEGNPIFSLDHPNRPQKILDLEIFNPTHQTKMQQLHKSLSGFYWNGLKNEMAMKMEEGEDRKEIEQGKKDKGEGVYIWRERVIRDYPVTVLFLSFSLLPNTHHTTCPPAVLNSK